MKTIHLFTLAFLLFACKNKTDVSTVMHNIEVDNQNLIVIEQDYSKALNIANQEDKILFIDFYTSWCVPCKKLDKLIFQNDSIKHILKNDVVLLKYNAENDTTFHLSKKHHVSSYPTGLTLNKNGHVLNRKYGFPGNHFEALSKNVLEFIQESVELNKANKTLKGYSNKLDDSKYPRFYIDYVNRTDIKINNSELSNYLINTSDKLSEEYFSTLIYFGRDAPAQIADMVLKNKQKYINLYGEKDVEILLYFLTSAKFDAAISDVSQEKFDKALAFTQKALSQEWLDDILPNYEKDFLKAQNKWHEVFQINKTLKDKGQYDNGSINHFCWQVYKDCDDQKVIKKCLEWMKEITKEEPSYAYLDTYAFLMFKSGNKKEARKIALLAIESAKKNDKNYRSMEELMGKL